MSPTACGALFGARTTPQPSHHPAALAEPRGTLVEPWWNPRGTLPQGRPAIWSETPKLSAVGEKQFNPFVFLSPMVVLSL